LDFPTDVAVTGVNATTTFTVTVLPPSGRMLTVFSPEEPEPRFQALSGGAGQRHVDGKLAKHTTRPLIVNNRR
jgi:hypothetical protein